MAASANTSRPLRFLRRASGSMEPPVFEFPVGETDTTWRSGDAAVFPASPDGKIDRGTGAIAISDIDGRGLVGFFVGPSASAPTFPTAAGVQGIFTSPASLTTNDPILATEFISVVLALGDCVFVANQLNNVTDITAPVRVPAAGTGGLFRRQGLRESTPTGETSRLFVDSSVLGSGNAIALPMAYAYPQMPQARGTGAGADPNRVILGASGTSNPAVEFMTMGTVFNPSLA